MYPGCINTKPKVSSPVFSDNIMQQSKRNKVLSDKIPEHIAIIMDGNGRWANSRSLPRIAGHKEGINSVREITRICGEIGVKYLTLYTFSTENWKRPPMEVRALMTLLLKTINIEIIPYQNKENYFKIKNILLDDYAVVPQKIGRYDKMFMNYTIYDFCWHTKIKLFSDREPLVKFYRTYPHNPFLGYHNYK